MFESEQELVDLICQDIQAGWHAQDILAYREQARLAKATQRLDAIHMDGVGQLEMSIDPYIYHSWGRKYGYEIWGDKEFKRQFMRDNPEVRRNTKRENRVGYTGNK